MFFFSSGSALFLCWVLAGWFVGCGSGGGLRGYGEALASGASVSVPVCSALGSRRPYPEWRKRVKKIPTLFVRDPNDMRHVTREVHRACGWVIDGEGVPLRKFDGTCVMFDGQRWWTRREVKPGKMPPNGFVQIEHDEITGKTVGWEPAEQSSWWKYLEEAVADSEVWLTGTYELVGPKVNGNPEGFTGHLLVEHANSDVIEDAPRDYDRLAVFLAGFPHEGIVWHHADGRMAKIKRRDFR